MGQDVAAPGSKVVTEYLDRAGLTEYLDELGFNLVGYGCTTCIGNSGPLPDEISEAVGDADLAVVSVLSGNRNFEGRINPDVKMNYLASPPLCVAYALAGHDGRRPLRGSARRGSTTGEPVYLQGHLADLGRGRADGRRRRSSPTCSARATPRCSTATSAGTPSPCRPASCSPGTTLDLRAPAAVLRGTAARAGAGRGHRRDARVLAVLGDSVTTDHISPAGSIKRDGPAATLPQREPRRVRGTSTPTARGAATTR